MNIEELGSTHNGMSGKPKDRRDRITAQQMFVIEMAAEHGYRSCEKGRNLQAALEAIRALYVVAEPHTLPVLGHKYRPTDELWGEPDGGGE